jgi:hypothetical protein
VEVTTMFGGNRRLPLLLAVAGLVAVGTGIGIAAAQGEGGAPPVKFFPIAVADLAPFTSEVQLKDGGKINVALSGGNTVFAIREVRIDPGAALPWHQHPGTAFVLLAQGTATEYNTAFPHCGPLVRTAPYARYEPGNTTHMLWNRGKKEVVIMVASFDSPKVIKSGKLIIPEPKPNVPGCPNAPR